VRSAPFPHGLSLRRAVGFYGRAVDRLDRATTFACALLLATVVLLTAAEILGRTLFASSSVEMVDLALQLAILMYFIGYLTLLNRDQDITMDYFYVRLPVRVRRVVDLLTAIAIAGFFVLLLVKSIALFRLGLRYPHPVFPVPHAVIVIPAILGAAGGLIVALRKALDTILARPEAQP
jgi:TRAP-type C4-dicarboxylate transport system permease small subunit